MVKTRTAFSIRVYPKSEDSYTVEAYNRLDAYELFLMMTIQGHVGQLIQTITKTDNSNATKCTQTIILSTVGKQSLNGRHRTAPISYGTFTPVVREQKKVCVK